MTTILATRQGVWADSRVTSDFIEPNPHPKVVRENGWIIGVAGNLHMLTLYRRWAAYSFRIGYEPPGITDDDSEVVALSAAGLLTFESGIPMWGYPPEVIGSGAAYVHAALLAGTDPYRAVEIAIELDPGSGGGVHAFYLDHGK